MASQNGSISPEMQAGNVEYKLKIVNPSKQRFEHLVTQLNWRLGEGNGEAIYKIGVEDNGTLTGISVDDMNASLETLERMSSKLDSTISVIKEETLRNCKKIAEVLVRKMTNDQNSTETRVAVLGNADAGKSTLLGVLTQGILDNGKGKARLNMFRHLHEIRTGRTSSISHEILGFDNKGRPINYSYDEFMTARKICDISTKLVKFVDLAGHKKYVHTTIQGLTGCSPHIVMLVISSSSGAIGMAHEHLTITMALNLKFFIVITKTDLMSPRNTLESLESFLKQGGCYKIPFLLTHENDMTTVENGKFDMVPVFCVSSVNGEGLDLLLKFLYVFSPNGNNELLKKSPEFHIDENFSCGDRGKIIHGLLVKGIIKEGANMKVGPFKDGSFEEIKIKSIHRNRVPCRVIYAGQNAAMSLEPVKPNLRKGMVLIGADSNINCCWYFQANIFLLYQSNKITKGFQATAHIGSVRQTVVIVEIFNAVCVSANETAAVLMKFKTRPEYVQVGNQMIFRADHSKAIGKITKTFPLSFRP